ncbi:MAG: DUF2075 domain-containing protein [Firmicutes bacterium]|uniref:DUF2075 domain-containing protein n=1 Tax=Candidatus Onthovivens merdipullorum TaxID=2840889 RepID=A0A9D9DN63_9BACL|nr:DUF2075 domain-containing protein [Candidatus Onthovivens merdipullorum]
MIIYNKSLKDFRTDVTFNTMQSILLKTLREKGLSGGSASEINSRNNSLHFMKDVLDDSYFDNECQVAIEYNIPQTSKRVDFMIMGNNNTEDHVVIIELKQWARVNKVDDNCDHSIMSDLRSHEPVAHPSYQAYSYKQLILDYSNDSVSINNKTLKPCAYLHNLSEEYRPIIEDNLYHEWIEEAPVFLQSDVLKLRNFVKNYIKLKANDGSLLYKIEEGRLKPTKSLQDALDSMLCGNEEFHMIDEQVVAYDKIMKAIKESQNDTRKHVLIITGGPGTGKSVLAINILARCIIDLKLNTSYITKNMAPRKCYANLLAKGNAKKMVNLQKAIQSPWCLPNTIYNGLDVGIFDEAHRMQKKPYRYLGNDMLEDAIKASKVSIFFVDDDQRITINDKYDVNSIIMYAKNENAIIHKPYELTSQFRCDGSDGYISFLNNLLEIKQTANTNFEFNNLKVKVFDDPIKMRDELRELNKINNKTRMIAGYCYDWNVKNKKGEWDIILPNGFKAKWNLANDDHWAVNPNSFEEVGCIHTCQGMEFDYVGIIIGKDLYYKDGHVQTNRNAISKDDKTSGIRLKSTSNEEADKLIRRTYKVLLTRGIKGCYIYCEDEALRNYLKEKLNKN